MRVPGITPTRRIEREYEREMRSLYITPLLEAVAAAVAATDGSDSAFIAAVSAVVARYEVEASRRFPREAVRRWATKVASDHRLRFIRQFARTAKVDISPALSEIDGTLRDVIEENVRLIQTIPRRFHDGLVDRVAAAQRVAPLDQKAQEALFRKEGKVSGYNLRRITRDQSNKLTGRLSEIRQTDVGIERYRWSTSSDDRVRPTHEEKHGRVFEWGRPPSDTGHPGHDIQCRCVAIPDITIAEVRQRWG